MKSLTSDQMKLLYLISKKSVIRQGERNITWLKELSLLSLVFEGIQRGIFTDYDYAPSLVKFQGVQLYANVSQEYLKDIDHLMERDFLYKLKLNTKYYDNISAYCVTPNVKEIDLVISQEMKHEIDELMSCPHCRTMIKVFVKDGRASLVCPDCGHTYQTKFFELENISYHSIAYFSGGGR